MIVSVSNTGPGLYAFGTAEPELMGHVAPVLYSAMPSINMCYVSNKERVVSSSEAVINSPDERLEYLLGGVVKVSDWKGKGSQLAATRNAVSFFGDLAAGIVSRGYAIDTATAEKFIKIKQGLPGVGKTRVSDNMAHSTTVNPFADENPIGKKNVRSPVQNLFETGISFKDEKDDFQVYLVSNWALKDFIRFPQLEALYNAMRVLKADGKVDEKATMDRAVKFHSKLMLDIAEKRFPKPMSKKERLEEPTAGITFEEQVGAYSEKLREYAGLPKDVAFPIPAVDIPEVFGRGGAAGDDVNAPDKRIGDAREVDVGGRVGGDETAAVYQSQRARRPEAAEVGGEDARTAAVVHRAGVALAKLRELVQRALERDVARKLDGILADGGDRARRCRGRCAGGATR